MKIGMNLLLWGTEINDSLFPVLEQIKSLGFDGVEVPDHLCLGEGSYSPKVFEETVGHFLIEDSQACLHFSLQPFDDFHDVLGILSHVFSELEFGLDVLLLVKLHVA